MPAETVTLAEAMALLQLSKQRLGQLVKDGWIKRPPSRGRYGLADVVQGYIRFLRDDARRSSKSAAHSRLQDVRVRKEELAIAERERELVPLADAMNVIDRLNGGMIAGIRALPARLTRDVEMRARMQQEIDDFLHEMADEAAKFGAALRSGRDDTAPDEEDAAGRMGAE